MCRECREPFPRRRLQKKPIVSDPGMHHGTSVTHVPVAGKTFPAFPAHAQFCVTSKRLIAWVPKTAHKGLMKMKLHWTCNKSYNHPVKNSPLVVYCEYVFISFSSFIWKHWIASKMCDECELKQVIQSMYMASARAFCALFNQYDMPQKQSSVIHYVYVIHHTDSFNRI